jgi:hypothetical protein
MATSTTTRPVLNDKDFARLVTVTKDADSVELKLTVPEPDQRATAMALNLDPLDAQVRQVFFFDTPDLQLDQHGIVVRARRVQGRGDDSVVKLRPVVPAELDRAVRTSPNFGVEVDAMPGGFVCSGSLKARLPNPAVRETLSRNRPIHKLFTKEQRAFYAAHAPAGIELDDLSVLGPIFVLKLKYAFEDYARKLVAELWLYPDGARIFELSTKCLPAEAFQVAAETRAQLTGCGVSLGGIQQTKTRTALTYFAAKLATT